MSKKSIRSEDVERVFEAWRKRRPRPDACVLSTSRRRAIAARLRDYTVEQIILVVDYLYEADTPDARWMRGSNPRHREYLDLENILRVERLAGRVEAATIWREDRAQRPPEGETYIPSLFPGE